MVGVHRDLHRVADVVAGDALHGLVPAQRPEIDPLGVREPVGVRVRVPDPHDPAVDDGRVGVVVVEQERRDLLDAFLESGVDEHPAVLVDQPGDQHVHVPVPPGEGQPAGEPADGDPAVPVVPESDLAARLRLGEVELVGPRVHQDVGHPGVFLEVQARLGELAGQPPGHGDIREDERR